MRTKKLYLKTIGEIASDRLFSEIQQVWYKMSHLLFESCKQIHSNLQYNVHFVQLLRISKIKPVVSDPNLGLRHTE